MPLRKLKNAGEFVTSFEGLIELDSHSFSATVAANLCQKVRWPNMSIPFILKRTGISVVFAVNRFYLLEICDHI